MINAIIEAISAALDSEFGEKYTIHMEEIKQGLEEPCFFIESINPANKLFPGKRYFRTNPFCIHYFPEAEEYQRECNDVAERLWPCLEYVLIQNDTRPIRGTKMNHQVTDGVLHFFVNYDYFIVKEEQKTPMEALQTDTEVKE